MICYRYFFALFISFLSIGLDKVLIVNGHKFPVSSVCLSWCSPVFAAMFQNDMIERTSKEIEIKDVASADHFADFLAALSPAEPRHPNRLTFFTIISLQPSTISSSDEGIIYSVHIIGKSY